jgi:hypothetical protein
MGTGRYTAFIKPERIGADARGLKEKDGSPLGLGWMAHYQSTEQPRRRRVTGGGRSRPRVRPPSGDGVMATSASRRATPDPLDPGPSHDRAGFAFLDPALAGRRLDCRYGSPGPEGLLPWIECGGEEMYNRIVASIRKVTGAYKNGALAAITV